jgi:RNA recognition motif-containing protein
MDESDVKSNIIFIAGLLPTTTKEEVLKLFKRFGKILSVDLIRKRAENVYAFIEFDDMRDAADVVW